jgi:hypothetical protein
MRFTTITTIAITLVGVVLAAPGIVGQNCYRIKRPIQTPSCVLPTFWAMRKALCSSENNWGEGFPFLSGHGVNLHQKDNCTADSLPEGAYIDIYMTISSTIKDRDDCWNRTESIIKNCVDDDGGLFNGGEFWDTRDDEAPPGQTFIWMQWLRFDPPPPPDPCYEYPPPPYCTYYPETRR